jgi:uncharacterized protein (DUF1501 family)
LPDARTQAASDILSLSYQNLQARAYAKLASKATSANALLRNAIQATADPYWTVPFPFSSPGIQLKMIARMIEAGSRSVANHGFGMKRQIFFCIATGYDLNNNETDGPGSTTTGAHAELLAELSRGLLSFQRAIEQLDLANNVTTFTASEFGRDLRSNSTGCDHGWGGHHLAFGGAVKGQRTYGRYPTQPPTGRTPYSVVPGFRPPRLTSIVPRWYVVRH